MPAHLRAVPPRDGYQRRPIHFDAVRAAAAQGSLWEQPPPEAVAEAPAAAIRVHALDRLFAKQLPEAAGTPSGSPQKPAAAPPACSSAAAADADAGSERGSPARLASRGSLALGAKRPVVRLFTGGRKAVNIEILMRKMGSPPQVAQAVQELDSGRLQVRCRCRRCTAAAGLLLLC